MTNPCSYSSVSRKYFNFKIIDIRNNIVLSSSDNPDQAECLTFTRDKFAIYFKGPTNLARGLSYTYTVSVERPASSISLEVYTKDTGIVFDPSVITFEDYETTTNKTFTASVKYASSLGTHKFTLIKTEYTRVSASTITINSNDIYSTPPALQVEVDDLDPSKQLRPYVIIEDLIDYGGVGAVFYAYGHLTMLPSQKFSMDISLP